MDNEYVRHPSLIPRAWHERLKAWAGTVTIVAGALGFLMSKWQGLATHEDVAAASKACDARCIQVDARIDTSIKPVAQDLVDVRVELRALTAQNELLMKSWAGEQAVRNEQRRGFGACARDIRRLAEERYELYQRKGQAPMSAALQASQDRIVLSCP